MEIQEMSNIKLESHKMDVFIYGKAGTGKTVLGSTFPRPIYIDTEAGLLSVRKKDISFLTCKRSDNKLGWWQDIKKATGLAMSSPDHDSIIIDSFSGVYDAMLGAIEAQPALTVSQQGKQDGFKKWTLLWEWALNYIALVRGSTKNTLFICGEAFDQDDTGRAFFHPSLIGQGKTKAAHYFDEVYRSEILDKGKESTYRLRIRPTDLHMAKSRVLDKADSTTHIKMHFQDIKSMLLK